MKQFLPIVAQLVDDSQVGVPRVGVTSSQVSTALQIVFAIFGAVAVLIIALSALRIVLSKGNSQDLSKARDAIIYAAVGLAISMMSFIIVRFVLQEI